MQQTAVTSLAILLATILGCQAVSTRPNKHIVRSFERIDRLSIHRICADESTPPVKVDNPTAIKRLRDIYRDARWGSPIEAIPPGTVTIGAYFNGAEHFKLAFASGLLMEWSDNGSVRKSALNRDDQDWLRNFIDEEDPPATLVGRHP